MKLWKTFGISSREDISYYDTAGEFEAERFAVNLNRMIMDEMEEKGKEGVMVPLYRPQTALTGGQPWGLLVWTQAGEGSV